MGERYLCRCYPNLNSVVDLFCEVLSSRSHHNKGEDLGRNKS